MRLTAKKSLGQHFLNSKHVLGQIIAAAEIREGETVLEIGPGTGVLTEALLGAGANVIAVEKDSRAIQGLENKFHLDIENSRLKIIEGDVLDTDIFNLQSSIPNLEYCVVANIPYYITGAILEKFLEHEPRPSRMILLMQKEVADRIVARDAKESILSVSVKAFGKPHIIAKVPPGAFTPPPTVDSAILSITNISDAAFKERNLDIRSFFDIVRAGFAHKRKILISNLAEVMAREDLDKMWSDLGLDQNMRAEDLDIGQWLAIAEKARS